MFQHLREILKTININAQKQGQPVRVKHDALMHHGENKGKPKNLN